jgi:hypothetical protein
VGWLVSLEKFAKLTSQRDLSYIRGTKAFGKNQVRLELVSLDAFGLWYTFKLGVLSTTLEGCDPRWA